MGELPLVGRSNQNKAKAGQRRLLRVRAKRNRRALAAAPVELREFPFGVVAVTLCPPRKAAGPLRRPKMRPKKAPPEKDPLAPY